MLHGATEVLGRVHAGQLRLDRTLDVWVADQTAAMDLQSRLLPHLTSLRELLDRNGEDFAQWLSRRASRTERNAARDNLTRRRVEGAGLVEELGRADALLGSDVAAAERHWAADACVGRGIRVEEKTAASPCEQARRDELRHLMVLTRETPHSLADTSVSTRNIAAATSPPDRSS